MAEACGRLNDVDAMLDEMTPEQMQELAAFDSLHPIGSEKICHTVALGFSAILQAFGATEVDPKNFLPWTKRRKKKQIEQSTSGKVVSPNQAAMMFSMAMGGVQTIGRPG